MKPYIPETLPIENLNFQRLFKLVGEANGELARFDGVLQGCVNADLMLSPLANDEAVQSSRIEGTQATLQDWLEYEGGIAKPESIQNDSREISNYRRTMQYGAQTIRSRDLSLTLVRELHQCLMQGVRGGDKTPGSFRTKQNFIGHYNSTIEQATFIPPDPIRLQADLDAWERYILGDDVEVLLQCAIMHAQFELLHPFNDGNGRTGRLLIPLFLCKKGKISTPSLYMSGYFERHRDTYYNRLHNISLHKDWTSWVEFFLLSVSKQANANYMQVRKIIDLYNKMKEYLACYKNGITALDSLFQSPIFSSADYIKNTGLEERTARSLLSKIRKLGLLEELVPSSGRSPAIFAFKQLLNIAESRNLYQK